MNLMGDLLEPSNNMDSLFPRCSPKSSPTTPATTNITFLSSLESPKTVASDINLNKQKNSPDFNQNKAQVPLSQTKLSRMDRHISNRMDLSSPTDQHHPVNVVYDDMFQPQSMATSSEDVYGRSCSSGSSSPGMETRRKGDRHHTRIRDPIFCDTKIERAGGREIVSRSRSARHKRSSKSDSHPKRSTKNYDSGTVKNCDSITTKPYDSLSQTQQRNSLNSSECRDGREYKIRYQEGDRIERTKHRNEKGGVTQCVTQELVGAQGLPQEIKKVLLPEQARTDRQRFPQLNTGEGDPGGGVSTGLSAMRETIFSAEIHSVEYEKPGLDEGNQRETVLFDDIGDIELDTEDLCTLSNYESGLDPKVTYDLIEGHLPPPGLTVLTGGNSGYSNQTRTSVDELLSQTPEAALQDNTLDHGTSFCLGREADSGVVTDAGPCASNNSPALDSRLSLLSPSASVSLDNLYLGEEASSDVSRVIGALTITEYEGSPRRYGPRKSASSSPQTRQCPPTWTLQDPSLTSLVQNQTASQCASIRQEDQTIEKPARPEDSNQTLLCRLEDQTTPGSAEQSNLTLAGQSGVSPPEDQQPTLLGGPATNFSGSSSPGQSVTSSKSVSPQSRRNQGRRVPGFPKRVVEAPKPSVNPVDPPGSGSGSLQHETVKSVDTEATKREQSIAELSADDSGKAGLSLLHFDEGEETLVSGQQGTLTQSGNSTLVEQTDIFSSCQTERMTTGAVMATTGSMANLPSAGRTFPPDQGYDYRYEFSETRKVLEEFFKAENEFPTTSSQTQANGSAPHESHNSIHTGKYRSSQIDDLDYSLKRHAGNSYVGQRLADADDDIVPAVISKHTPSPHNHMTAISPGKVRDDPYSRDLLDLCGGTIPSLAQQPNVGLSPLNSKSESLPSQGDKSVHQYVNKVNEHSSKMSNISVRSVIVDQNPGVPRLSQVMDTSFIHSSRDTDSGRVRDCLEVQFDASRELPPPPPAYDSRNFTLSPETTDCDSADLESELSVPSAGEGSYHSSGPRLHTSMPILEDGLSSGHASDLEDDLEVLTANSSALTTQAPCTKRRGDVGNNFRRQIVEVELEMNDSEKEAGGQQRGTGQPNIQSEHQNKNGHMISNIMALDSLSSRLPPPSPAPENPPSHLLSPSSPEDPHSVAAAIKDIRKAIQSAKTLHPTHGCVTGTGNDPWLPRGGERVEPPLPAPLPPTSCPPTPPSPACSTPPPPPPVELHEETESEIEEERVPTPEILKKEDEDLDTDQETDRLLGQQYNDDTGYYDTAKNESSKKKPSKTKEGPVTDPKVLIEGVLFRARYLGSTQLVCEGQPTKATRMMQAEEAVSRIKALAPEGESQPSTEVDLFISTEKIMVLNTDLKEIMMDHGLRTISYIADIGELVVIMARRRILPQDGEEPQVIGTTPKMICHVFESEEAQFIAQSIGQAFQVAYMEFLKANGIEDHSFVKEMDYQEVLNSQEIYGDELAMFAKKELQKEVVVPKAKGEILGVVIVESGWGSMLPTIVIANLCPNGPAARCGQLNIGDQVIAINGVSLVGLPLSTCQQYIKNTKNKTAVKLTAVSCPPVVEVKIKRPDTKYQLGFSVQNGVICSLLRGGIAERGGVRVGHRIIEINGQSVVAVPHERIVNLLATSVGEIHMKTMPTSMYRLLTGQENPVYI